MPARIRHITVDSRDPFHQAQFWGDVLGFADDPSDPNQPGEPEALIVDPSGRHPGLLFIAVDEEKAVKNRVHLDLQPDEPRDVAVDRLVTLGGAVIADHRRPDGSGWVVMADLEGNELCVERSAAERDDRTQPPVAAERRQPPIHAADERTMLTGMLDWYRDGVTGKVQGISQAHASATPLRSSSSVAGLVKHLALVEDYWFTVDFAGQPVPEPWLGIDWDADPDWEFHSAVGQPIDELLGLYAAACERSRAVVADRELDAIGADTSRREFSLRFALVHLIEETARHLGHLDVLREHLDGTLGE